MNSLKPDEIPVFFKTRKSFRAWLKKYHTNETELWVLFYKVHTKIPCIKYIEAVEEALCFGWIDGKLKRIDDQKHMQRFTPRNPKSVWSKINKDRALKLIKDGLMTEAGLQKIKAAKKSGWWEKAYSSSLASSDPVEELKSALMKNKKAKVFFDSLTQKQQSQYYLWINLAKRNETKMKRIKKVIELLTDKKKPGYFE